MSSKFKSTSTKRNGSNRYYVYVFRGDECTQVKQTKPLTTESKAMKVMNSQFDSDDTITTGQIVESKTIRFYHRHEYTDDKLFCTRCGEYRK